MQPYRWNGAGIMCVVHHNHVQGHNLWYGKLVKSYCPLLFHWYCCFAILCDVIFCFALVLDCKIEIAVEWILALWCLLYDPVLWILVMWWHFRCTWSCSRRANALQEAAFKKRETDWKDGHWTHRLVWNAVSLLRWERCGWMVFEWRTTICVRCKRYINPCEV